jgi:signal transduction histidine kinase/ActR/RegA family two-component response regulator
MNNKNHANSETGEERRVNWQPGEDTLKLLHELQVQHIELEMQNEELRVARHSMELLLQQYTELYDFAPVGYFTLAQDGTILQVNLAGATLLYQQRGILVGQKVSKFVAQNDKAVFSAFLHKLCTSKEMENCELFIAGNGVTPRYLHIDGIVGAPLVYSSLVGSVVDGTAIDGTHGEYFRVVVTDITERTLLEQAMNAKNLALASATAVAEKANQAKSEFLSSMSHELRTPLNAVLGFAQLIESSTPPPTPLQKLSIDQILKGGWYLLQLINEILDLARIESGKVSILSEVMSLSDLMHDCHTMIEPLAQQHKITLLLPDINHPHYIKADKIRVKQVIINLLSNAIKYNRINGTVTVRCTRISETHMRISIQDTGAGISAEHLSQLFQPFNRLGQTGTAEAGTGIGLVVTKQLVELMGGVIGVKSIVGSGSEFWVDFPAASAPVEEVEPLLEFVAHKESIAAIPVKGTYHTLLCVEDNPDNLLLVEKLIARRHDIKLLTAIDGYLGIQMALVYHPDVILMDINLPGINGLGALKILREHPETRHIPVIALSAHANQHDIDIGLEAGFFRYLTKPVKVHEFMEALDAALSHAAENSSQSLKT